MARLSGRAPKTGSKPACQERARLVRDVELDPNFGRKLDQSGQLDVDDPTQFFLREGSEHDDVVDPVEEFRPEVSVQLTTHPILNLFPCSFLSGLQDVLAPDIGRHQDDHVTKIDRTSLCVGKAPIVQDLEKDVEHLRMSLFDFIEEHDGVRPTANGFRELSTLIVPDIPWRRPDQTCDRVLLHVLGHIDAHERTLVIEDELCERLRRLGLSHPSGAEEDERSDRAVRILEPSP